MCEIKVIGVYYKCSTLGLAQWVRLTYTLTKFILKILESLRIPNLQIKIGHIYIYIYIFFF